MADMKTTLAELLAAHHLVLPKDDEGWTAEEMAQATGRPPSKIREMIRAGIEAGTIKVGRKRRETIAGWGRMEPCYRLVKAKKKRAGR